MAIDVSRLRMIARGEITEENGVTGVAGVTDVTGYAQKTPELRRLRELRLKNTKVEKDGFEGVTSHVTNFPAPAPAPIFDPDARRAEADRRNRDAIAAGITDRFCACGSLASTCWASHRGAEIWRCDDCGGAR